ncbi:unnamed protein product [Citrullus colocynthis]|uniref:Uncharacterized protein n=1 Tax=Citrullus colocynthis TaxID=252529 RepID=A0ABP0YA66_9ROSI
MENIEAEEDESFKDVDTKPKMAINPSRDHVLTRTSEKPECSDQPKGEGGLSKPDTGFDTTKSGLELERIQKNEIDEMVKALYRRVEELEEKIRQQSRFPSNSDCGSCNEQYSEDEVLGPVNNWNLQKVITFFPNSSSFQ